MIIESRLPARRLLRRVAICAMRAALKTGRPPKAPSRAKENNCISLPNGLACDIARRFSLRFIPTTGLGGTKRIVWLSNHERESHMSFTQLNPCLPVTVEGKGKGSAFAVIDYGQEHNLIWVVALDDSGEIWCSPNPRVPPSI
jgi:hypothetical protein